MFRLVKVVVGSLFFMFVICGLCAVSAHAGGPVQPMFSMFIHGIPGSNNQTGCSIEGLIDPPSYSDGEGNVSFVYPAHSDQFTVAYWLDNTNKLKIQTHSAPNAVGDMPFEGKIEVGANDTRTSLTFDWWIDNYQSPLSWYVSIYRIDTRGNVFSRLVEPEDGSDWGTVTIPMSRQGYDILAVAWDTSTVPEPGSMLALGSGIIGFAGFGLRRRRS